MCAGVVGVGGVPSVFLSARALRTRRAQPYEKNPSRFQGSPSPSQPRWPGQGVRAAMKPVRLAHHMDVGAGGMVRWAMGMGMGQKIARPPPIPLRDMVS